MPSPCSEGDLSGCYGLYRVAAMVTPPEGYTEQWELPYGPLTPVSEIQASLQSAVDALAADAVAVITETEESGLVIGPRRVAVRLGCSVIYRGSPDVYDTTDGIWTVQVAIWAPAPVSPVPLDYAHLAGLWVSRLTEVELPSAAPAAAVVAVNGVSVVLGEQLVALPGDYPPDRVDERGVRLTRLVELAEPQLGNPAVQDALATDGA